MGSAPGDTLRDTLTFLAILGECLACTLIAAPVQAGKRYRVGFQNFYVITRYNRSPLYAMAVNDLAQAILTRALADDAP